MNVLTASQDCAPTPPSFGGWILWLTLLCLLSLGVTGYVAVLRPRRRRAPLLQAIPLLTSDQKDALERAEQLLTDALATGLRSADLDDARFCLSFARAMLARFDPGKYREAATAIGETGTRTHRHPSAAYLELWLHARTRDHDAVIAVYERHGELLAEHPDAERLASISLLHRAKLRWRRHEIDEAMRDFETVWRLGALRDELPATLADLQVSHGVRALLDSDLADARSSFLEACRRAEESGEPDVDARLGLVVCDWDTDLPGAETRLGEVLDDLDRVSGQDVAQAGTTADRVLLAQAALLHIVLLLRSWLVRLPRGGGLPREELAEFRARTDRAGTADPDFGDVLLVRGFVDYHFGDDQDGAVDSLERATTAGKGVGLPEILHLVARHRRPPGSGPAESDPYLQLLRAFLLDGGVPVELRVELDRVMGKFPRYRQWSAAADHQIDTTPPLSVDDVIRRGTALHLRVAPLVAADGRAGAPDVDGNRLRQLSDEHARAMAALRTSADLLARVEQALMAHTGEIWLAEDDVTAGSEENGHA